MWMTRNDTFYGLTLLKKSMLLQQIFVVIIIMSIMEERLPVIMAILIVKYQPNDVLFHSAGEVFRFLVESIKSFPRRRAHLNIYLSVEDEDHLKRFFSNAQCRIALETNANFEFSKFGSQTADDKLGKEIKRNKQIRLVLPVNDRKVIGNMFAFLFVHTSHAYFCTLFAHCCFV
jgi:hypothetical protein